MYTKKSLKKYLKDVAALRCVCVSVWVCGWV